jgi:hypothetical protein
MAQFDLNREALVGAREITKDGMPMSARQLVARTAIAEALDKRPTFSELYVAASPYLRELLGFYPAASGLGRFVLESHTAPASHPACDETQCGFILYDRGFVKAQGMTEHQAMASTDDAYEWIVASLNRIDGRTPGRNPLMGAHAREYLAEMYDNGHQLVERHNQIEVDFALSGNAYPAGL